MHFLGFLLLVVGVSSVDPGITVSFTNDTVSNAFALYAGTTVSFLERNYGDYSKSFTYLDATAHVTLHNITLSSLQYNPILTRITLQEPEFIIFQLSQVSFLLDANYTLKLLTSSNGWMKLKESDSDLALNVSITNSAQGKPIAVFNGAQLTIGSAVISTDMDFALRDFIQREINDHLPDLEVYAPQLLASVFPDINALIESYSLQFPLLKDVQIDVSLVDTVQVVSKYLSIPLNGTVFSKSPSRTPATPEPIPAYGSLPEPIQAQLSDYAINTALAAVWWSFSYYLEELPPQFPIQLNTDELALFIPQLRNYFGANKPLAFSVTPNQQAGLPVYQTNGNVSVSLCVNLEILCNPDGAGWESGLTLAFSLESSFTGWVTNNILSVSLWSIHIDSVTVVNTSVGPIDIESFVIFLRKAVAGFLPQVNAYLSDIYLPIDDIFVFTVLKDDVVIEDGYLSAGVEVGVMLS